MLHCFVRALGDWWRLWRCWFWLKRFDPLVVVCLRDPFCFKSAPSALARNIIRVLQNTENGIGLHAARPQERNRPSPQGFRSPFSSRQIYTHRPIVRATTLCASQSRYNKFIIVSVCVCVNTYRNRSNYHTEYVDVVVSETFETWQTHTLRF